MTSQKLPVTITSPRSSVPFEAEISPDCPVGLMLERLQSSSATDHGPFLAKETPGKPYVLPLARTRQQIPRDGTVGDAGLQPHDVINVDQMAQGA